MTNRIDACRPAIAMLLFATASCSMPGCAAQQSEGTRSDPRQEVNAGTTGQVGGISVVEGGNPEAQPIVVVASYRFDRNGVHPREAIMAFGAGNEPRSDGADFRFQLMGAQDRPLSEFGVMDPRRAVVEEEGLVENPEATYAARFPFHPATRAIRVLDATGREVARTDLVPVIREFCSRMRDDQVCAEAMRSLR